MGNFDWQGRILQDGVNVAGVFSKSRDILLQELRHYASIYSEDGPVILEIREGKRKWKVYKP